MKQAFESKESILNYLADDYFERGLVTSDFKKMLFERERVGQYGLKTELLFPMLSPRQLRKTKLTFMALESPIK